MTDQMKKQVLLNLLLKTSFFKTVTDNTYWSEMQKIFEELNLPIHELVGEYSQDVLLCGYNEDDVRQLWNKGELNECYLRATESEMNGDWITQGIHAKIKGDWQTIITLAVIKAKGWPVEWSSEPESLDTLTEAEMCIITKQR
jgi:hypothetical protein